MHSDKDLDKKSEPEPKKDRVVVEAKDRVLHGLDQKIKDTKDLGEKVIEPAKHLIDKEYDKLDEQKRKIDDKQDELYEKKEKLDELKREKVDEPVKKAQKEFVERIKEKESPEKLVSQLGYNLGSQRVEGTHPESVKELMAAKNKLHSAIDTDLNKAGVVVDSKLHDIGNKVGITRIATDEGLEQQP